jgi:hypothetical protein
MGEIDRVNMDIYDLPWVLLICLGDEECSFPIERLEHPNKKIWIQEPMIPGKHETIPARYILDGYSHDFHAFIDRGVHRDYEWSFAGQVTHPRRRACMDALRTIDWGGVVVESRGYCQGVSKREYVNLLQRSQIVPCPSGPMSPDAARPWEALEAGAIPILDELSPTRSEPGFWKAVLGDHPLPTVTDWSILPAIIEELKRESTAVRSRICQDWWFEYKVDFIRWFGQDLEELGCHRTKLQF